jgi:hypothetical protein
MITIVNVLFIRMPMVFRRPPRGTSARYSKAVTRSANQTVILYNKLSETREYDEPILAQIIKIKLYKVFL